MAIFIVGVELSSDSEQFKAEGFAGGFVNCYVPTNDIREAINITEQTLLDDGYMILFIESVSVFEEDAWQHEPDIIELCKNVIDTQEVTYGEFQVYGH